jgi:cytosine/adenosine deaminase-related metal-dependent hydrolase
MVESANLARKLGLRMHTHLAETIDMEQDCVDRFGRRSVDVLEELGWIDNDVWFAHVIHLNASEIVRLGAAGTGIAHCPSSNGRLGAGLCPVRDFLDAGAPVGLGVDGSASSEGGTLFPEIKMALYFARLLSGPSAMSPTQALELATVGGARCLGRPDLGRLEVGAPADIAVWPADDIEDIEDPIAGLVLGPTREVRHLLVGGDEVVIDGEVQGIDLRAAHTELARRARAFWD